MTLEEYTWLEQDYSTSETDVRTFLKQKGVNLHTYYYWKRKSREHKEESAQRAGQFLPIDFQPGGSIKPSKCSRNLKQPLVSQGEIEIELRTPSGAEIRIRGYMDSIMVSTIIASTGGGHFMILSKRLMRWELHLNKEESCDAVKHIRYL